jgi:DNA-binding response OmpR family regulator/anti-sigma regulatory factor (Ser/Thr protein kinase)
VRVLVADDNADMRDHLARLLRAEGWSVETVADGRQALEAVLADPPDLLLTDVMMPELDGFELVRACAADPRTATLPVVVLSARAGEGASVEGLDLGADDYVVKPFVSQDLVARLRGTLVLARQRSAHVSQLRVLADAASLVTSGRRLDDALRALTEQVRAALRAREVRVLLAADDGPALSYTAGEPGGRADDEVLTTNRARPARPRPRHAVPRGCPAAEALRPRRGTARAAHRVLAAVVRRLARQRDTAVAATLQAFLLPGAASELAGLELAAPTGPAEQEVQVGGDWYDVLELPDGRVALSVGDVAGQGLTSALVMGQLRTAVRAYALEGLPPREAVAALDDLVARMPGGSLSTVFLGYLDVTTGALVWCSAGHPPPALLSGTSATWLEGEVTPPLGRRLRRPGRRQHRRPARGRPAGPVHRRARGGPHLAAGRGHAGAAGAAQGVPRRRAAALVAAVLGEPGLRRTDDTAVLVVHRRARTAARAAVLHEVDRLLQVEASPQAAGLVRREVRPLLRRAGVDDEVVFELLLGLSEAVNNAVEHPVDTSSDQVLVHVRLDSAARTVRLAVRDSGRWRERRPSMDRGRGATLMAASASVHVRPGEDGTEVALERQL